MKKSFVSLVLAIAMLLNFGCAHKHMFGEWVDGIRTCECGETEACEHIFSEWNNGIRTCTICNIKDSCEHVYNNWTNGSRICSVCKLEETCQHKDYDIESKYILACTECGSKVKATSDDLYRIAREKHEFTYKDIGKEDIISYMKIIGVNSTGYYTEHKELVAKMYTGIWSDNGIDREVELLFRYDNGWKDVIPSFVELRERTFEIVGHVTKNSVDSLWIDVYYIY